MQIVKDRPRTLAPAPAAAAPASRAVVVLSALTGTLGLVTSGVGLLWRGSGSPVAFTTLHGQTEQLLGRGLYRNDTLFAAANNFGSDIVVLVLALPLLALALRGYRRGSLRAQLLLLGALGYLLYIGASYALGAVAYNELFLVYVALLATSLFGLVAAVASVDLHALAARLPQRVPRRWPGWFMVASGVVTLVIWGSDPVAALLTGEPPARLGTSTTLFTHALDIAVIVPSAVLAGVLILRRQVFGYVVAFSLLVLEAFLLPSIALATLAQVRFGISFTTGEIIGPIAGFGAFALLSVGVIVTMLRDVRRAPA